LHASADQPSCLIPDPENRSIHSCMACGAGYVEQRAKAGDNPTAIAHDLSFKHCAHYRDGTPFCRICYVCLLSSLMLAWSYERGLPKDVGDAEPIRKVIRELIRKHGNPLATQMFSPFPHMRPKRETAYLG
jgi:hypothetical protein